MGKAVKRPLEFYAGDLPGRQNWDIHLRRFHGFILGRFPVLIGLCQWV